MRRGLAVVILTGHDGRHEGREHEEEHAEKETTSIVVRFGRFIANAEVEQANEDTNTQMRDQPQARQSLQNRTHRCKINLRRFKVCSYLSKKVYTSKDYEMYLHYSFL